MVGFIIPMMKEQKFRESEQLSQSHTASSQELSSAHPQILLSFVHVSLPHYHPCCLVSVPHALSSNMPFPVARPPSPSSPFPICPLHGLQMSRGALLTAPCAVMVHQNPTPQS